MSSSRRFFPASDGTASVSTSSCWTASPITSAFAKTPAAYGAFVEEKRGEAETLIVKAAAKAAVVVADEFPCGEYPAILSRAAEKISVLVEAVDSNGLLPLRAAERVFTTAYSFRRFLQKSARKPRLRAASHAAVGDENPSRRENRVDSGGTGAPGPSRGAQQERKDRSKDSQSTTK